jgi:hypothetical protein
MAPVPVEAFRLFREMLNEIGTEIDWDVLDKISLRLDPLSRAITLEWDDVDDTDYREIEGLLLTYEQEKDQKKPRRE